jgi:hypothetical protein
LFNQERTEGEKFRPDVEGQTAMILRSAISRIVLIFPGSYGLICRVRGPVLYRNHFALGGLNAWVADQPINGFRKEPLDHPNHRRIIGREDRFEVIAQSRPYG